MDREDLIAMLLLIGCPKPYRFEDQRFVNIVDGAQPLAVIITPREITVSWRMADAATGHFKIHAEDFKGANAAEEAWEWIQQWI